jgi:hypothetical protein
MPLVLDIARETACAIATLLHFTAIGIEDAIAKIDLRILRVFQQQDLVAANPKMAIGDMANHFGAQPDILPDSVDHHEIIAQALHFGKLQFHPVLLV